MIKALFKKQMAEVFSWLFMDRKKGRRTGKGMVGFLLLYAALVAYLGGMIFMAGKFLCQALVPMGLTWFYFTIMGLLSLMLGVFGSVFNTYASLYLAKDNDMLLAMPIPPRYILFVRLVGVYVMGLFFELIVMLPATIAWFIYGEPTALGAVFALLSPLFLSFLVLALSCLLGLLVAVISTHVKRKSLITVLFSLGALALYMWGYTKLMSSLTELLAIVGDIAEAVKGPLFPFYHMGRAAEGKGLSFLIFATVMLGVFLLICPLLSRSFLKLATTNKGAAKKTYTRTKAAQRSAGKALLIKEFKRLISSPVYLLNCALGALFLPIGGVMLLVFREEINLVLPVFAEIFGDADIVPLLLAAVACMMGAMIDLTAPSISLEGKHLWLVQSLPVTPLQILHAKLSMHLLIGVPPALFATVCLLIAATPTLPFFFLIPVAMLSFILLIALFGLFINLKMPNLTWTSEVVPVKQSAAVTVTLLGSWGVVLALGALYVPLRHHLPAALYLCICCAAFLGVCATLYAWLRRKGTKIFATL